MNEFLHGTSVPIESDKDALIGTSELMPHYTDGRFTGDSYKARTVFLSGDREVVVRDFGDEAVEGAHYVYSDRIPLWFDSAAIANASKQAEAKTGNSKSARYFEEYLRILNDDSTIEMVHILTGVNVSNGYYYQVFGYTSTKTE